MDRAGILPLYKPDGFCRVTRGVRSVLAYDWECAAGGFECPRVPVLSDPNHLWTYANLPLPVGPLQKPFGTTAFENNNRIIDFTSSFVKDYR